MAADSDMIFGELAEASPRRERRPDDNRHYAVRAVGSPQADEMPVYFDLDALQQMEWHAQSNTNVELGGVMLGAQCVDPQGQPFVVVRDVLPAEHYEATKGSFKFTHDTWAEITRQRQLFPADTQLVGWYHTHPDWGVFLSSLDTFICEHFFNRALDLALVIDPCRRDRGVFVWNGTQARKLRRLRGFYLITSRLRQPALDNYVEELEREATMSQLSSPFRTGSSSPPPVVYVAGGQSPWLVVAVLLAGLLQFCLLALVAYRILGPQPAAPASSGATAETTAATERWLVEQRRVWEADAKLQVVDRLLAESQDGLPDAATQLAARDQQVAQLQASVQGLDAARRETQRLADQRAQELQSLRQDAQRREAALRAELAASKADLLAVQKRSRELAAELASARPANAPVGAEPVAGWQAWWNVATGSAVALAAAAVLLVATALFAAGRRRAARRYADLPPNDMTGS